MDAPNAKPAETPPDDERVMDLVACAGNAEHMALKLRGLGLGGLAVKAADLAQQLRTKAAHEAMDAARERPQVVECDTRNCMLVAAERAAITGRDQLLQRKGQALCVAETVLDEHIAVARITPGAEVLLP